MMRITIDARMLGPEQTRGIGRYVQEIISAMLRIAPEHAYTLVTRQSNHPLASHPSVTTVAADIPWYSWREQVFLPRRFHETHSDVAFFPHWNVPLFFRGSFVVMIHDLLLRHEPMSAKASTRGPLIRWMKHLGYRIVLSHAIHAAKNILVPTEFVAQDIRRFYPRSASKIVVTGEGMPAIPKTPDVGRRTTSPYLLYVGSAYPHKGLQDVFEAWPLILATYPELSFKIAGEVDVFMRRFQDQVTSKRLERVEFLGRVTDDQLAALYRDALAFIYPSHFEGFGLPPLEAIAHGCPVLSSDAGPLVDVLGEHGAIFFHPGSPNAILSTVDEFLKDPEGARRRTEIEREKLALRHSWTRAAESTLSALQTPPT